MNYKIISTGSQGNAVIIEDILIDCGISAKLLKDDFRRIKLVLLTHIHSDHIKPSTIQWLARERPMLRFACCDYLVPTLLSCNVPKRNIDVLEVGKIYDYKAFKVSPVKLYHDVPNVGYRLFVGKEKAFYCTDTGHLQGITAKNYDLYLIEANYEDEELQQRIEEKTSQGLYCYELNVASRHLSQAQASEFLLENMGEQSRFEFIHQHKDKGNDIHG